MGLDRKMGQICQKAADGSTELISEYREFTLSREDEAGLIFISCDKLPDMFIALGNEGAIRAAIDTCLTNSFVGLTAQVFTNGSIAGPEIHTVVKLTK